MEHQLDPTHSAERLKARERIMLSIARVVFGATGHLDPTDTTDHEQPIEAEREEI